jgi:hypothetical protein
MPEWSTGICGCVDCSDCGFCCLATWCGCIAFGMNAALMQGKRGSSPCCIGCDSTCECSESCQYAYCGEACTAYWLPDALAKFAASRGEFDLGAVGVSAAASLLTASYVQNQLVVVGKHLKIYDKLPPMCGCCNEPCCLSICCGPCMLTRVHHELINDTTNHTYQFEPGSSVKFANSMFEGVKILT